jgi:DNA transformation protein and related proteins
VHRKKSTDAIFIHSMMKPHKPTTATTGPDRLVEATRNTEIEHNQPLSEVQNLGPKSQQMLARAGITTFSQLRRHGSVLAYVLVKQAGCNVSLNLLWALEGALTNLPWQVVAREHRTSLLLALEEHQRA